MLCSWAFLSPLSKAMGWAPGPVSSSVDGARGWVLWPALAIMTAESVLSVSLVAADAARPWLERTAEKARTGGALFVPVAHDAPDSDDDAQSEDDEDDERRRRQVGEDMRARRARARAEDEPSTRAVLLGAALSCVSCVVIVASIFGEDGIKWWATVIALLLACVFSVLGCVRFLLFLPAPARPLADEPLRLVPAAFGLSARPI